MSKRGNGEGNVIQRKDGRWMSRVSLPDGSRKAFYGRTEAEVIKAKNEAIGKLINNLPLGDDTLTVGQWLTTWLANTAAQRVGPLTQRRYAVIVNHHLIPRLGRIRLNKLTPAHVERMMRDGLESGQAPRSVAHHRAVLRTALNVAIKHGMISRNVAALADAPHVPEKERDVITPSKAKGIFKAVESDRLEALYVLLLASGLRLGEALALRWSDIDMDAGSVRVQRTVQRLDGTWTFLETKTKRSRRVVPVHSRVVQILKEHRMRQLEERLSLGAHRDGDQWGNLVFTSETSGPVYASYAYQHFRKLLRNAGLPEIRIHDLRHGAASLWAAMGVPARAAMELLGHSNISTTMNIYTGVAPEWGRELIDSVGNRLWGESEKA